MSFIERNIQNIQHKYRKKRLSYEKKEAILKIVEKCIRIIIEMVGS